jgi:hypothetical protein
MRGCPALLVAVVGALVVPGGARAESPVFLDRTPLLDAGVPCAADYECGTFFCVDGVCCDGPCTGRCHQCNQPGHEGTCLPVEPGTDPRGECPGSGPCRATCDSLGSCAYPGEDHVCVAAACVAGTDRVNRGSTCNGQGACVDRGTQDCSPFTCRAGYCPNTCSSEADCAIGFTCLGASCGGSRPRGAPCVSAAECASGYCAHGVCCDTACTGFCARCDQPDSAGTVDGTCRPMVGQALAGACPGYGLCVGVCASADSCRLPGTDMACALCYACDGYGSCNALPASKDDARCGDMQCSALSNPCRTVEAGPRCLAPGACATPRTGNVCNVVTMQPDGTRCWPGHADWLCAAGACVGPADAGVPDAPPPDAQSDRDPRRSAYCGCSIEGRPGMGLALVALVVLGRRRR